MDNPFNINQLSFQVLSPTQEPVNNIGDVGCCSRYVGCSNAGKCLIPDREYAASCAYRKKLEAKKVFYGETADNFSSKRYKALLSAIDALPEGSRRTLDDLTIDVCEYHRAASHAVARSDFLVGLPALSLFDFSPLDETFLKKCNFRRLSTLVSSHPIYGPMFLQAKKDGKGKKPGPSTADFLLAWLSHDGLPLRAELFAPYCLAHVRMDSRCYLEAYYRDTLLASFDSRIYPRSPLAEDGLLSPGDYKTEELHRIAMSRGYSQEEKDRLTSVMDAEATNVDGAGRTE